MAKEEKYIYKCQECGGTNVQIKIWYYPNEEKLANGDELDKNDVWCDDCEDHTGYDVILEEK